MEDFGVVSGQPAGGVAQAADASLARASPEYAWVDGQIGSVQPVEVPVHDAPHCVLSLERVGADEFRATTASGVRTVDSGLLQTLPGGLARLAKLVARERNGEPRAAQAGRASPAADEAMGEAAVVEALVCAEAAPALVAADSTETMAADASLARASRRSGAGSVAGAPGSADALRTSPGSAQAGRVSPAADETTGEAAVVEAPVWCRGACCSSEKAAAPTMGRQWTMQNYSSVVCVEYPRKVTSYLSIYSLFARTILICATCGSRCLRIKNTGVKSASGSLGLIT